MTVLPLQCAAQLWFPVRVLRCAERMFERILISCSCSRQVRARKRLYEEHKASPLPPSKLRREACSADTGEARQASADQVPTLHMMLLIPDSCKHRTNENGTVQSRFPSC